jgi:hypothetical protein
MYGAKFTQRTQTMIHPLRYAKAVQVSAVLNQIKSPFRSGESQVIADEFSNTLILKDTPEKLKEMQEVLRQLDRPTSTRAYSLNYAEAEKFKEKLDGVLSQVGAFSFDARTNKFVVTDQPEVLEKTDQMVKAFDVPDGEVLIEAKIVKVELTDQMDLGIDWNQVFASVDMSARSNFDSVSGDVSAGGSMMVGGSVKAGGDVRAGNVTTGSIRGPVTAGTVINMGGGGGGAGGGAAGGTAARYPADRPLVRLSEPARSAPRAPAGLLARAPLPQGSSGVRLAAAAGLPLEYDGAGSATVVFAPGFSEPAPAVTARPAPRRVLSRQDAEATAEASEAAAVEPAAPAPAAAAAAGGGGGDDIDEIDEKVVERLRGDLLAEREKMGDLLGDVL